MKISDAVDIKIIPISFMNVLQIYSSTIISIDFFVQCLKKKNNDVYICKRNIIMIYLKNFFRHPNGKFGAEKKNRNKKKCIKMFNER